jgi:hypothetical protein
LLQAVAPVTLNVPPGHSADAGADDVDPAMHA